MRIIQVLMQLCRDDLLAASSLSSEAMYNLIRSGAPAAHDVSEKNEAQVDILNVTTGNIILTYSGHNGSIASVEWAPNSKYLASAGYDNTAQVWALLPTNSFVEPLKARKALKKRCFSSTQTLLPFSCRGRKIRCGKSTGFQGRNDCSFCLISPFSRIFLLSVDSRNELVGSNEPRLRLGGRAGRMLGRGHSLSRSFRSCIRCSKMNLQRLILKARPYGLMINQHSR